MLTPPIVSAVTAAILVCLQMLLMLDVVRARFRHRQSFGDGGIPALTVAIRRHGNLAENSGIFLASFTILEIIGTSRVSMIVLCAVFVLARLIHVLALTASSFQKLRPMGVGLTVMVSVGLVARLILAVLGTGHG